MGRGQRKLNKKRRRRQRRRNLIQLNHTKHGGLNYRLLRTQDSIELASKRNQRRGQRKRDSSRRKVTFQKQQHRHHEGGGQQSTSRASRRKKKELMLDIEPPFQDIVILKDVAVGHRTMKHHKHLSHYRSLSPFTRMTLHHSARPNHQGFNAAA